jgi:hypothetical protein
LQVDADAERLRVGDGLADHARHADLVKRQREGHAADAATGDQDGRCGDRMRHACILFDAKRGTNELRLRLA